MGAFSKLFFKFKVKKELGAFFQMLDGYSPTWQTYDGGVYEMELTRACVNTFATHCSKLAPEIVGADVKGIKSIFNGKPNLFMTTAQLVSKIAAIYEAQNTCFIVPVLDQWDKLIGYYPVAAQQVELREQDGQPFLVYTFGNGERAAIELERVGVVSKFLYTNDLMGEDNGVLDATMQLLATQNQGITEGIKNSASFRFMATVNNFLKKEDLAKERKSWVADNLGVDSGGLALFPNNYSNVQQIQSAAQIVNPDEVRLIQERVYTYFGTNEKILHNEAVGDAWSAYYEGKIEPFAIQLSQAMTMMTYTAAERSRGNAIVWSANRLQYMTSTDKLQVSSQMFDRGVLSINQVMDIWNLPHVEGGDKRYIRKEYIEVSQLDAANKQPQPAEPVGPADPEPADPIDGGGDNDPERQDKI